jgi:hypothetical protein
MNLDQEQQEYLIQSAKQRAVLAAIVAGVMALEGEPTLQEIKHYVANSYARIPMQGYLVHDAIDMDVIKIFQDWAVGEVAISEIKEMLS